MITTVTKTNGSSNPAKQSSHQSQDAGPAPKPRRANIQYQATKAEDQQHYCVPNSRPPRRKERLEKRTEKIRACKQTQTCSMNRTYSSKHTCKNESTQEKIKITIHTEEKHNCTYRYQAFKSISQSNQNSI
mmetsp:Transcript_28731/g.42602  ORF Transcript_28731/g.42602 Transcript_28731/m.42602 type:complete len:131 (-) Transcript_28731:797-1189(-)